MKGIDLSPKMKLLPAEQELVVQYVPGERPLGDSMGGLQMFSDVFKRGYGNKVFGSDQNGIWLGGADYDNAKFKVDMEGNLALSGSGSSIVIYDADTGLPSIVIRG
jgi:hypothetical protein